MRLIDCFGFYNEVEMLAYRLNILDHLVDMFVIVESRHTFSGQEKKCTFDENKHLEPFSRFRHKIIHIIVDDFPFKYPNIDYAKNEQWANEHFQRNCIERGLNKLNLCAEDIFTITDLDEIPDPQTLARIKMGEIQVTANMLEMDFYYYNLNSKIVNKWLFPKIVSYGVFKQMGIPCEGYRFMNCPVIQKGGWHLSYFGDIHFIKNKIVNFAHQEFNNDEFTDLSKIEQRVNGSADLFDRDYNPVSKISSYHNEYMPPEYGGFVAKNTLF
jgi:beta-1,4-mannosyl-glycoprotein beta-1,4-N-acetylglucosaminyltransferase